MKKTLILTGKIFSFELFESIREGFDYVIACDKAAYLAAKEGVSFDCAVGDFDSVDEEGITLIKEKAKEVVVLNPIKDDTDTAHALSLCKEASSITILGGIQGKRIEHFLATLLLAQNDPRIEWMDETSHILSLGKGIHQISRGGYRFFSIFAIEPSRISLSGFAYNLSSYSLALNDPLGVSNQLESENGIIEVEEGRILLIRTKDDSELPLEK